MSNINNSILDKIIENGKISHAYLFETNYSEENMKIIYDYVKNIFCTNFDDNLSENIKRRIDENNYPDLKIIKRDTSVIKKEQIIELKEYFSVTPQENEERIYIIYEAEKMNESAANTLLKFLEEPEGKIIGILLTENKNSVISTLVSRCQIISLDKKLDFIEPENYMLITEFLLSLFKDKINIYTKLNSYDELFVTKDVLLNTMEVMLVILSDIINYKVTNKFIYIKSNKNIDYILDKYDEYFISKKITILNDLIDKQKYNLNLNLFLDNLIIQLCGDD